MSLRLRTGIEFFYRMKITALLEWAETVREMTEGK
jgi:hypothetical protein|nr:MAG TPA: hypothetical protein [Caudoviricetes sp.]DAR92884.1 MAG TPA: hypothetical protein [Caudoviricetes sp.]DAT43427.1 MAG TPA: hypothetical protein [Caudoviricetes sp.]DAY04349.1 MAG TPA: hypothetical protein [Caudoviricetes sp.]